MAQGEFTKEEATSCEEALGEIIKAMPKKKLAEFLGHFNDIGLFLRAAKDAAPSEAKGTVTTMTIDEARAAVRRGEKVACDTCGEPAACVGTYEDMEAPEPACNACCGHGCEDGYCEQIAVD